MSNCLQDLESSCIIFNTTSNNEERKNAENYIQKFKKSHSIDNYVYVLNNSSNEMLIYETLAAYCDAIINNWADFLTNTQRSSNPSEKLIAMDSKPSDQMNQLLGYIMEWTLRNQPRLSHSVWSQALITISKFIKKSYSENIIIYYNEYMKKVQDFINSNDMKNKVIALDMIHGILDIFSGMNITNQQLKISRESELKLRQIFEKKNLSEIFLLLVNLLNSYLPLHDSIESHESETFLKSLLSNLEMILSWNFLNKVQTLKWKIMPKNENAKRFSPPTKWSEIITDLSIIEFLFKVHDKVRSNSRLGIISLSCLNQLAGLKVKFRHNSLIDSSYAINYYRFSHIEFSFVFIDVMCQFFKPSNNGDNGDSFITKDLYDYEVPLMADIIYQLQEHLTSTVWLDGLLLQINDKGLVVDNDGNIPRSFAVEYSQFVVEKMSNFIFFYCSFCLKCIDGGASENLSKSDTIFIETEEKVLSRFVSFTNFHEYLQYTEYRSGPIDPNMVSTGDWDRFVFQDLIKTSTQCSGTIFERFLKSHLASPDGFRNVTPDCDIIIIESDSDDLELDIEEDDKKAFEGGLYAAGFSALQCIPDSLPYLSNLFHTRMLQLEHVHKCSENPSFSILEDLHWLVSILGYTILNITDDLIIQNRIIYSRHLDSNDLRPLYEHSRVQLKSMTVLELNEEVAVDRIIKQYQHLLANCVVNNFNNVDYSFTMDLTCCDDVIRLFFLTMRSLVFCVRCCESGQLISDLIWILNRWMIGYVNLLDDCESPKLSDVPLLTIFLGESGLGCRKQIVDNVLNIIRITVEVWNQDPTVIKAVVNFMSNITSCVSIARLLLNSEVWLKEMTQLIVTAAPPFIILGEEMFSQLITSVMNVASATENEGQLDAYLQVLNPIGLRLNKLFSSPDISKVLESEIITCLSFIRGMVMTKWPSRLSRSSTQWSMGYCRLFDTLYPWLERSVNVLCEHHLYNTVVIQSLLECFLEVSKSVLLELNQSQTTQFYLLNLNIFRLYSRKSFNNQSVSSNMTKEDTISEIKLIFSIASELLSRQVFDEFDLDSNSSNEEVLGYDVISQLIYQLAPFISSDILEVPEVGTVFFHCITLVTEFKASTFLAKMNYEFNSSLLGLLGDSIFNTNTQISTYSLRAVSSLADDYYNFTAPSTKPSRNQVQMSFSLANEFNSILLRVFNWLRSNNVVSDMLDTVSSAMIALVKLNPEYFLSILSEWLNSLNNSFVTKKIEDSINTLNLLHEKGSMLSSYHRNNVNDWNIVVQLISNYGDL